ncbi:MAG: hypothetical protein GQ576_06295, partial [Methanococcoides sp.]|nr:hypothetical protein [Methanococcoides sp.]
MAGYVKLHRDIADNDLWLLEPFTKAQAWVDLFMNANWKNGVVNIRGNIVEIERGQIGWSELTMVKRWKWSRMKVRRFLSYLEKCGNIRQHKTQLTTVITICNYEHYQSDEAARGTTDETIDETAERQQKDNRRDTIEEGKEGKEGKELDSKPLSSKPDIAEKIFGFWCEVMAKGNSKFTAKRKKAVAARIKDGYTEEDFMQAILNCSRSPFHMGENDRQTLYNDLELICRSGEKLESFRDSIGKGCQPEQKRLVTY